MADKTKISWTDASWNVIVGCSKCSPGCLNCYAEKMAVRLAFMGNEAYAKVVNRGTVNSWNGKTCFNAIALNKPLHWKKPRKIFVCSMGDLFHESVPFEWIDKVFAVMALCPQHTFQVLTKRADRMKEYFNRHVKMRTEDFASEMSGKQIRLTDRWPLPNVWLGVTAENQEMADKRIPILLQTPAAKRFVSVEPMLGPVDLTYRYDGSGSTITRLDLLDWVIVGAESGAGRRKCVNEWIIKIENQCADAGVPIFVKQIQDTKTGKLIKDPAGWPREFPKG